MLLSPGTPAFSEWSSPSSPVTASFFLFSVENAVAVAAGKVTKPVLRQMGPYVFRERQEREVVEQDEEEEVAFTVTRTW